MHQRAELIQERRDVLLLLRGDLEAHVGRSLLPGPFHGGYLELELDDVERLVLDQLLQFNEEALFTKLARHLDLGSRGQVRNGLLGNATTSPSSTPAA